MRTDILTEKNTMTAIQAALLHQAHKKAFLYKYFYDKKKSRRNALNDLYSYWNEKSDVVIDNNTLLYKEAVFYNGLILELTKFFNLSSDKALDVYRGIDLNEVKKYEIILTEEDI